MPNPPPKVAVTMDIRLTVEIVDEGYLGVEATVREHMERAREEVERNWSFLVSKGSLPPLPVTASLPRIMSVSIIPRVDA